MNSKRVLAGAALLALVACGGGGDSGTPPTNEPPTLKFETTAIAVPKDSQTNLTVSASDPDGDGVTITWDFTRGTWSSQNSANTVMRWTAPATAGVDTITINANDGTESTTLSVVMKVGTRLTATDLLSLMTKANSPYILAPINSPPTMNAPASRPTTTIEAGVELLIDIKDMQINVLGELQANGTADEPIVIRPNNRSFKCTTDQGWWKGIRAATDDAELFDGFVNFNHVEVRDAKWGVRLSDNSRALLQDCRIVCSSDAGVLVEGNGSLRAIDSRISDGAGDGIALVALSSLPDSVRISGCNLSFNGTAGIHMDLNDTGAVVPIVVDHNQIEFNGSYGIVLSNSVFPSIHYNVFRGNGESSVSSLYLTSGYPDPVNRPTLDATCNYWGSATSSQATIDASIRDSLDTSTVHTRVISCPWLNSSPIGASPACTCPP